MADAPLLLCRWGEIRLFCSQINTDGGRTQVVHEPASGDKHIVQDRGLRVRRVRCRLQFDEFPGAPAPRDAALLLEDAKNSGAVQMFTHPLLGRFLASVGEFTSEIDASGIIVGEAEFIAESEDIAVSPIGVTAFGVSGESSVTSAAELLDFELQSVGLLKTSGPTANLLSPALGPGLSFGSGLAANLSLNPTVNLSVDISASIALNVSAAATASASASASASVSTSATVALTGTATGSITASVDLSVGLAAAASAECAIGLFAAATIDARVAVAGWASGTTSTRQIGIDAARISDNIDTAIFVAGMENDLTLFGAYRTAIMLGDAVRAAAAAATSETSSVFVMRIRDTTALLPLAARIYGGTDAQDRARQIAQLNDIPTPGWLPPGDYLMPTRPRQAA